MDIPAVVKNSNLYSRLIGDTELLTAVLSLRDVAGRLADTVSRTVPAFTDHTIRHMDALWGVTDRVLTPPEVAALSHGEAFLLACGFYLHDIGMAYAATDEGLHESVLRRCTRALWQVLPLLRMMMRHSRRWARAHSTGDSTLTARANWRRVRFREPTFTCSTRCQSERHGRRHVAALLRAITGASKRLSANLEPRELCPCQAVAGAISATLVTPPPYRLRPSKDRLSAEDRPYLSQAHRAGELDPLACPRTH